MTPVTIHGTLGDYLWIDQDGAIPVRKDDLHSIADDVIRSRKWHTYRDGVHWTLADIVHLSMSLGLGLVDELDPCVRCRTLPILHGGEHCIECAGIVQDQSDATMRIARLA